MRRMLFAVIILLLSCVSYADSTTVTVVGNWWVGEEEEGFTPEPLWSYGESIQTTDGPEWSYGESVSREENE